MRKAVSNIPWQMHKCRSTSRVHPKACLCPPRLPNLGSFSRQKTVVKQHRMPGPWIFGMHSIPLIRRTHMTQDPSLFACDELIDLQNSMRDPESPDQTRRKRTNLILSERGGRDLRRTAPRTQVSKAKWTACHAYHWLAKKIVTRGPAPMSIP